MEQLINKIQNKYPFEYIGNQLLINADCMDVMELMDDKSVDAIICDPPYGTTACKWDSVIPFEPMWKKLNRVIKLNGAIALFGSEPFSSALRMSNIKNYKYDWIWEKQKASNFMSMKYQPAKYHENISVFNNHAYYPIMWKTEENKIDKRKTINNPYTNKEHIGNKIQRTRNIDSGYRNPKSILKINKDINTNIHPTQKPVALIEYLTKTYTNENELVLDFTAGSFTTAIACIRTNRQSICIEKDEEYYKLGVNRVREELRQTDMFRITPKAKICR